MNPAISHPLVGVGLRPAHLDFFCHQPTPLSWLEIHSENYLAPFSPARRTLQHIRANYDISCHGIGLSLGSATSINPDHLRQLQALVNDIEPIMVSDHLSWSEHGGHYFNDLLPLPYTEEALNVFCRNVLQVQDALARPLLIENPSSYLRFSHSTIDEWTFLAEVQRRTDCRLLLDLNNVQVSAFNHGFAVATYLAAIPADAVDEIHLAGYSVRQLPQGEIRIDSHNRPVSDALWQLFRAWTARHGVRRTLIEWDTDLPEAQVLLAEADHAAQILRQVTSARYRHPVDSLMAQGGADEL
ncbi:MULTISPECIES: MNIO family bufferin maturase [Vibrio]|uniref:DUF692 domain-containing protein n=1 Tax=Vibrio ostreae TaxID=2841925 RepID=A0A975UA17_9VIBR|nr:MULTISPECIES: DUF692 domain-containing protein [Vibrio]QXO17316.1 DUF692 domain-containing protein [Vibrio ostreae]